MEKGIALSKIQELLEKVQALADTLMMIGRLEEGEEDIKSATIGTIGKMINEYVIKIFEALEEHLNGR
jgi:hypothetical protein